MNKELEILKSDLVMKCLEIRNLQYYISMMSEKLNKTIMECRELNKKIQDAEWEVGVQQLENYVNSPTGMVQMIEYAAKKIKENKKPE